MLGCLIGDLAMSGSHWQGMFFPSLRAISVFFFNLRDVTSHKEKFPFPSTKICRTTCCRLPPLELCLRSLDRPKVPRQKPAPFMGDILSRVLIAIYKPRDCHSGTETGDAAGTRTGGEGGAGRYGFVC